MNLLRIAEAKALSHRRVQLTLTNTQIVERDLSPLLQGPVFEAIRSDNALFQQLRVEAGTLVWPGGADLCPDVLIWGGLPPDHSADAAA